MNNLAVIKANVDAYIKTNGIGSITGAVDNSVLNDAMDKIYEDLYGLGYHFKGVASVGTLPGSPAEKAFYVNTYSSSSQNYSGFGAGITVPSYQIGVFLWDMSTWVFSLFATVTAAVGAGDVVDDGGSSTSGNIVIENAADGKHVIDSGVPVQGVYKKGLTVGSYSKAFSDDTMIDRISVRKINGSPSIKIGTTLGGSEILPVTLVSDVISLTNLNQYFETGSSIYYVLSGTGTASIRFDYTNKFFS